MTESGTAAIHDSVDAVELGGAQPALVLLLSEPAAGAPARVFVDAVRASLGSASPCRVLALDELRQAGLDSSPVQPVHRIELERHFAREIAALVSGPRALAPRARLPLFIVGNLSEAAGRRHAWSLLPVLFGALSRVALPRGVDPVIAGIWTLPAVWSPADGAELFAWLKELARGIGAPFTTNGNGSHASYAMAAILGRSDAHELEPGRAVARGDVGLMTRAAELVAACCATRLLDWIAAVRRGRPHAHGLLGFGIEALSHDVFRQPDTLTRSIDSSRILWPVDALARPAGAAELARAVAGSIGLGDERFADWDRVDSTQQGGASSRGWLVQMAHGLEPRHIIGVQHWRRFYTLLSREQRCAAHTLPEAVDWPDPLEARRAAHVTVESDDAPPLL